MLKLKSITRDLTQAARESRIDPAVGREKETFAILQLLSRKNPQSVLVVGDTGVGKTHFVHGLTVAGMRPSKAENVLGFNLLELDLPAFLPARQNASEALSTLIDFLRGSSDVILFIDDIHLVLLPERGGENGSLAASMLVPTIKKGEITCIGALPTHDFETLQRLDPDLVKAFEVIRLEQMSEAATLQVLQKACASLSMHHGVAIAKEACEAAVALTVKCMPNVKLPGKAIDVLDQACARYKLKLVAKDNYPELVDDASMVKLGEKVKAHDVKRVIREITAIDVDKELAAEWQAKLESRLKKSVPGHDKAISELASAMSLVRTNMADSKPVAGTILLQEGKLDDVVEMLRALTYQLFGNHDNLFIHDMSQSATANDAAELFGLNDSKNVSPLVTGAERSPLAIMAFTNIEKADAHFHDILLPILLTGSLRLPNGRMANFRRTLFAIIEGQSAHLHVTPGSKGKSCLPQQMLDCADATISVS